LKALALGAKAVLIGRPYVWGLAAFVLAVALALWIGSIPIPKPVFAFG
jgi:isopentenyl diphosphate isomerase/L-lactate dehydrogenase-like FMN-dependent dehydrogenase